MIDPVNRHLSWPRAHRVSTMALMALGLAACSNAAPPDAAPATGALHAEQAWVRVTPPNAPVAGGYLSLRNDGASDDRLVSISSPDAQRVEIHEMRMDGGTMQMRQLTDGVDVPARASITLEPGGTHLMLIGPTRPFVAGGQVTATLVYAKARPQTLILSVQPLGATAAPATAGERSSASGGHEGH